MRFHFCLNRGTYDYELICLAQGLAAIGHDVSADRSCWRKAAGGWVLEPKFPPSEADVVVMQAPHCRALHGTGIDHRYLGGRARTVLVDTSDALRTAAFDDCARRIDIIFKQMTGATVYPANCRTPWAFGLSDELCRITPLPWERRRPWIEVNHRNQHSTRLRAEMLLAPKVRGRFGFGAMDIPERPELDLPEELSMNADESGNRHRPDYMYRLSSAKVCLTAGGYFTGPRFVNALAVGRRVCRVLYVPGSGRINRTLARIGLRAPHFRQVYQWDSWRFWETMALGTVSLTYDLQAYGIRLPVMPVNWVHYVGLDFGSGFEKSCAKFMSLSDRELATIADAGRRWAIENYSPRAVADRLIEVLGNSSVTTCPMTRRQPIAHTGALDCE